MKSVGKYFSEIKDKRVAFIGAAVSHCDLIKMFLKKGINCVVLDKKDKEHFDKKTYDDLSALGAEFALGETYLDEMFSCDIVFRTPGMYYNDPTITRARESGIVITSEMETFFDLCPCKIYAITGSDGKSTTTTVISEIFKADGKTVHIGGNLGMALLPIIETIKEDDIAVVELSSFQLISMRESPDVAVITNITPNHLNVHGTMEEYIEAKCNILYHQNAYSKAVLNVDNEATKNLSYFVRGKLSYFTRQSKPNVGTFLDENNNLCYTDNGEVTKIVNKDEIKIPGMHNVENYLTAFAAVWGEASLESMIKVAKEFGGVEHRIEFVRELDGVRYYNNSIASSPTRVIACLNSFDQKQIIIAGGSDKGISFEPLAKPMNEKVKVLILMGQTAEKIEKAVTNCDEYKTNNLKIIRVTNMEEAVKTAKENAVKGDIVSLSPACASFDMYRMFEERGKHFKSIVNELK